MAGSFDFAGNAPPPPISDAVNVVAFRWDNSGQGAGGASGGGGGKYTALPNIKVLSVEYFEGARIPTARLQYIFDDAADKKYPRRAEQVVPIDAGGSNVVQTDDRIVIRVYLSDGSYALLFDGFAHVPQCDLGAEQEAVTIEVLGTPVREWDNPLFGIRIRNSDDTLNGTDVVVPGLHARFNPDGAGNCSPDGKDYHQDQSDARPVFIDPLIPFIRKDGGGADYDARVLWNLSGAARYVCFEGNPKQKYIDIYNADKFKDILDSRVAKGGDTGLIDPNKPSTYTSTPIEVPDLDVGNDPWPVALEKLIKPHGFTFRFYLDIDDATGDPHWRLYIYRLDTNVPLKTLKMDKPSRTTKLDSSKTNLHEMRIQRDHSGITNEFTCDSGLSRYEVGLVLEVAVEVRAGDDQPDALLTFVEGSPRFLPWPYREFVFNETGDGYWSGGSGVGATFKKAVISLDAIFGKPDPKKGPKYVVRPRSPLSKLISTDVKSGDQLPAELWIGTDYTGKKPGVWDGTGTWQQVTHGGWEIMDDRIGIKLTATDVQNWIMSDTPQAAAKKGIVSTGKVFQGGVVKVVTCLSNPDTEMKYFWFLLFAVIEGDAGLNVQADRRAASPTTFSIRKYIDQRTWFGNKIIHKSSIYGDTKKNIIVVDDTKEAQAQMDAYRKAHELGTMSGSATIKRFTQAYMVGDRIKKIDGRDISLKQNAATTQGEADVYPVVVGIRWDFDGKNETTLQLSDRRAEPNPERRRL